MMLDLKCFDAILFDIGNVLIDIDYNRAIVRFQEMAKIDFRSIVSYHTQISLFNDFEKGKISSNDFVAELKKFLHDDVSDQQIIDAWNLILLRYPKEKIELLQRLKNDFRIYALSNINELHITEIDKNVQQLYGINAFRDLFHHAFYSNEVGFRKPEEELYAIVLEQLKIAPKNILFIDDKEENLVPAKVLGIATVHLKQPEDLYSIF